MTIRVELNPEMEKQLAAEALARIARRFSGVTVLSPADVLASFR